MEDLGIKWLKRFSTGLFKASQAFQMYSLCREKCGKAAIKRKSRLLKGEINPVFAWHYVGETRLKWIFKKLSEDPCLHGSLCSSCWLLPGENIVLSASHPSNPFPSKAQGISWNLCKLRMTPYWGSFFLNRGNKNCFRVISDFLPCFPTVLLSLWLTCCDVTPWVVYSGPISWVPPSVVPLAFESRGRAAPHKEQALNVPRLPCCPFMVRKSGHVRMVYCLFGGRGEWPLQRHLE